MASCDNPKCINYVSFDDRVAIAKKLDKLDEIEKMLEKIDENTSRQDDYLVIEGMKALFGQPWDSEE